MYHSPTSLPPALSPQQYHLQEWHERECASVFGDSWHLIGTKSRLSKPGDYLTADVFGVSVVVRNFNGELVALRNVCAHRQCALVSKEHGHSEELKCPFHGWVYGEDGRTRRIPAAMNFPHFDRETHRLNRFPVATCGDLLFIKLTDEGLSLDEWLGPLREKFEQWFSLPDFKLCRSRKLPYPANWKIPVEASLESYHIPEVHPNTFGKDPGESQSEHAFAERSSSFFTEFLTPRWIDVWLKHTEQGLLRLMGAEVLSRYEHHHVFPNLLVSHTDSLSLAHVVMPTGPTSSVGCAWHFARQAGKRGPHWHMLANGWGRVSAALAFQVLNEDVAIYPHVQAGVQSAGGPGILGRCEERLHVFQEHVASRLAAGENGDSRSEATVAQQSGELAET